MNSKEFTFDSKIWLQSLASWLEKKRTQATATNLVTFKLVKRLYLILLKY